MKGCFVISLDFEMFWGVALSRSLAEYRPHVLGEWVAVPRMLKLFRKKRINATWATVGMLMCKDYDQWREIRPVEMPGYLKTQCATYTLEEKVQKHPELFFARPLVEEILQTPGQELGGHSYSHFYCMEPGATVSQFAGDLCCANEIATELGVTYSSFVFPRNQIQADYLVALEKSGYKVFRGNPRHWLYANGHGVRGGALGRTLRLSDAYFPISGTNTSQISKEQGLINCPASFFLRPWSGASFLETLRLRRLKSAMTAAAKSGGVFHLWWHPHNFGVNVEQNIAVLTELLEHYEILKDCYGMRSVSMAGCLS